MEIKLNTTMEGFFLKPAEALSILERLSRIEAKVDKLQPTESEEKVTNQDFCRLLQISKRTAQKLRDAGKVPFYKLGNKIYYERKAIDELLNKHSNPIIED